MDLLKYMLETCQYKLHSRILKSNSMDLLRLFKSSRLFFKSELLEVTPMDSSPGTCLPFFKSKEMMILPIKPFEKYPRIIQAGRSTFELIMKKHKASMKVRNIEESDLTLRTSIDLEIISDQGQQQDQY